MKAVIIFLLTIAGLFASGQSFVSPLRVDENVAVLAKKLAYAAVSSKKKILLSGDIATNIPGLYQKFFVFVCKGKRFSLYYQWQAGEPSLFNQEFLSLYVRKEGTDGPDDLRGYKDFHLNGTWDECRLGTFSYSFSPPDEGNNFDAEIQEDYRQALKEALSYFN